MSFASPTPTENPAGAGERRFDSRPRRRFVGGIAGTVLSCGGVFLALVVWGPNREPRWVVPLGVTAGFVCLAAATSPWWLGVRCRQCGARLAPTESRPRKGTPRPVAPLEFPCAHCHVVWETGLVSTGGGPEPGGAAGG